MNLANLHLFSSLSQVAWLPDGTHFASAGFDRCIFLWSLQGDPLHRWELGCRIQDLAATRDGSKLLVVDSEKSVKAPQKETSRWRF